MSNQSEKNQNRNTDGVTLNKVMVTVSALSISIAVSIGSYEYNKNLNHTDQNISRIEISQKKSEDDIREISKNIQSLIISQKIDYSMTMNMSAQIIKNEQSIEKLKTLFYNSPAHAQGKNENE